MKARRGDFVVVRSSQMVFSLKNGTSINERWEIMRAVKVKRDGVVSHVAPPYLYDRCKANAGSAIPTGVTVYTLGIRGRDKRLADLDGRSFYTGEDMRAALYGIWEPSP